MLIEGTVMKQSDRDRLDRAAEKLGMRRRDPAPEALALVPGARVWIMDASGQSSATWQWSESTAWHEAYAWRAEDGLGNPVEEDHDDWDYDGEDVGEPASVTGNG